MTKIGIINCGLGNLTSVNNAIKLAGAEPAVFSDPAAAESFAGLILPGVGSFDAGMRKLHETGFAEVVTRRSGAGVPLLGICLGMQLLATRGEEFKPTDGLGIIPGQISRMHSDRSDIRLPHIGWNDIAVQGAGILCAGLPENSAFYFVHSYAYADHTASYVRGTTDYGSPVVAVIEADNVFGVQFHPEKSQKAGLQVLKNFINAC